MSTLLERSLERLYHDKCTIYNKVEVFDAETKQTSFGSEVTEVDIPCRVSFSSIAAVQQGEATPALAQAVKLFLGPNIAVKPGSRIVVTRGGSKTEYRASGQPARYASHQEIALELADDFA